MSVGCTLLLAWCVPSRVTEGRSGVLGRCIGQSCGLVTIQPCGNKVSVSASYYNELHVKGVGFMHTAQATPIGDAV